MVRIGRIAGVVAVVLASGAAWGQGTEEQRPDARRDLREAARRTAEQRNFAFTQTLRQRMMGMEATVETAGRFEAPDLTRGTLHFAIPGMEDFVDPEQLRPMEFVAKGSAIRIRHEGDGEWTNPRAEEGGAGIPEDAAFPNPAAALEQAAESLRELSEDGEETVGNVLCRRFRGRAEGDGVREFLRRSMPGGGGQLDAMGSFEGATLELTVFVARESGLVLRIVQAYSIPIEMAQSAADLDVETTMSGFGESPVEVPEELREELGVPAEPNG